MFSCHTCLRRAINALLYSSFPDTIFSRTNVARVPRRPQRVAHHSTIRGIGKGHHLRVLREALKVGEKGKAEWRSARSVRKGPSPVERRDMVARERNRHHLDVEPPVVARGVDENGQSRTGVVHRDDPEKYQMQYLKDPLALAKAVLSRLKIGDDKSALKLVRLSDREKVENIVSWNHLMDYQMSIRKTREALRIYNDMKKRGHQPDAHTFTIMLRGFTQNIDQPQAVDNAVHIYNSMFAPRSAVTPNIIHTNAVINACARAKDMDTLWSIAGRLPEKGPGAPDKWTFTTILNALAVSVKENASSIAQEDASIEASTLAFDKAVSEGRRLWEDVVKRWRSGDLVVDQPLVCAMGRLLLLGSTRQDWNDVFMLVEQTMNISNARPLHNAGSSTLAKPEMGHVSPPGKEAIALQASPSNEFTPLGPRNNTPNSSSVPVFAYPGNNTLSMLLEAAISLRALPLGKQYWDILTDLEGPYKLRPDPENFHVYLRLLRLSRSSKVVCDLLRQYCLDSTDPAFAKRGTFVLAMSTCSRDKNNPNAFDHASTVLDIMQEKFDHPDPKVMEMYLSLAVVTTPGISHLMPNEQLNPDPRKNNAMRALARLGPRTVNIKDLIKTKMMEVETAAVMPRRKDKKHGKSRKEEGRGRAHLTMNDYAIEELSGFLQALIGVYDRLLAKGTKLPGPYVEDYLLQKKKLSAFVNKIVGIPKPSMVKKDVKETVEIADEDDDHVEEALSEMDQEGAAPKRGNRPSRLEIEAARIRGQFPPQSSKGYMRVTPTDTVRPSAIQAKRDATHGVKRPAGIERSGRKDEQTGYTPHGSDEVKRPSATRTSRGSPLSKKSEGLVQRGWGGGWDELVKREAPELSR